MADRYRPGEINQSHCQIELPPGLAEKAIRKLRDDLLEKATVIKLDDA